MPFFCGFLLFCFFLVRPKSWVIWFVFGPFFFYQPPPPPPRPNPLLSFLSHPIDSPLIGSSYVCSLAGQLHCCIAGHFQFIAGNSWLTAHAEYYGFTPADNPHDQAEIPLTAFPESFTAYLTQQGRRPGQCFLHCNGIPSWTLLRDLRCYAAKPSERKQLGHLAVSGERISVAGDIKVSMSTFFGQKSSMSR